MQLPKPVKREKRAPKPLKRTRPRRRRKGKMVSLRLEADRFWSLIVKHRGKCEIVWPHDCKLALQAMHGIPRTYRATRWLPINGFAGCQAAHYYFTKHPEEWTAYLLEAWGAEVFSELWRKARSHEKPDLEAVVESLRCELFKLKGIPEDEGGNE